MDWIILAQDADKFGGIKVSVFIKSAEKSAIADDELLLLRKECAAGRDGC